MTGKNTGWSRPADLRAQVQRLWDRGELLAELARADDSFPRRLILKGPSSPEIADRFEEAKAWAREIMAVSHCRVELRSFAHRIFGANAMPAEVWIDSLDSALAMIGKRGDAGRFAVLLETTRRRQPGLLPWLEKRPLKALELAERWPLLLDIVEWLQAHPRPAIYLRQVDIPGVHSKFIEAHRGVLAELFDGVLAPEIIDGSQGGVNQFNARYGFRDKPARLRFRALDAAKSPLPAAGLSDITLDSDSFNKLSMPASRVFITENETNFLALPPLPDSVAIFGSGYGWDSLAKAAWLADCRIYYWGDIDTHGFAILNQLRGRFPHAESLLMDRETLMAHETLWGHEDSQTLADQPLLTVAERELFDDLRDNRIRPNLRLEQEMIGFGWIQRVLAEKVLL